jgi:hypothetical protein
MSKHSGPLIHCLLRREKWRLLEAERVCLQKKFLLQHVMTHYLMDQVMLSESDDDDNVDNESYSDFEPEIGKKIKKILSHLSVIQKVEVSSNKISMIKINLCSCGGGLPHAKNKTLFQC